MNYNHSSAPTRRGVGHSRWIGPPQTMDPSDGLPNASGYMPPGPDMYNQQVPMTNDLPRERGFNVAEHSVPQYGFNSLPMQNKITVPGNYELQRDHGFIMPEQPIPQYGFNSPPMQNYQQNESRNDGYSSPHVVTQLLTQSILSNMATQYSDTAIGAGKQQFEKYVPVSALKYYFAVNTDYVCTKLALLFFPFTQKDWSVKYEQDVPLQPRYEKNAPDMYIPTMAFLTYVFIAAFVLGTKERFTPEQLGILASSAIAWGVIELVVHNVSLYVMNLETSLSTLDLLAYCSYKYVGMNVALLISLLFRRLGYYAVLMYYSVSLAFFLIRSLKLRVIPQNQSSYTASGHKRRLYFILFVAGIQPVLMWWMSYHLM